VKKIVRLISAVICFFQLNVQAEEPKEYTFAINSAVTPLLHAAFINETIKTVERSVAPAKLKVLYVELPELERLIENHQTDFFISTAATIRRYQDLGARDVLTASSPFSKNPNRSEGSLFIVKAGRSDINSISDLKDKRAAAGRPTAFGMYLAAMGEIAADGKRYKPHVVNRIIAPDGSVVKDFQPELLSQLDVPEEDIKLVQDGLHDVTKYGTAASSFRGFTVDIAGKTGTAENSQGRDHGWFVAYGPFDNPNIVVAVIVENGGYGSQSAVPIGRKILEAAFGLNQDSGDKK
jgi:hypothetical protein